MSFFSIKNLVYLFLIVSLIQSCKTDAKTNTSASIDGKNITKIESNMIYLEGGQKIELQEDSISKIFYLTRHAEKDTAAAFKADPPLTEAGVKRGAKIADIMRGTRIDAIYSTMTTRALYTVDSLADIKVMSILPYDNKNLSGIIDSVKTNKFYNRIFMVGHSNTIPAITNSLADRDVFNKIFDETDYSNFIIVVAKKSGKSDVYQLKY
jgi:phosphohistidine phosphatase SixA